MANYDGYSIVGPLFNPFVIGQSKELDVVDITITDFSNFNVTVGRAKELDEIKANQIVKNLGTLEEVPYYYLRAQDSGLTSPGFVFWNSYMADFTDSPTPTGSYSNLSVIESQIVPRIKYS